MSLSNNLGDAPGRANAGDNLLTLVASSLSGGDCINDADALRPVGTAAAIVRVVKAPFTLGTSVRADGGFYTHAVIALCRQTKVCFCITIRQRPRPRNLIEALPETNCTPRLQPDPAVEPVQLRQDPPPDPG